MMLQAGASLNLAFHVLDPSAQAPSRHLCTKFVQGDFNHEGQVVKFGQACDILTVEIEHVSLEALNKLASMGKEVHPSPQVLATIADKGLQKQFYEKHGFPTAPFRLVDGREPLYSHQEWLPAVQKLRKGGYDGKGVVVLKGLQDVDRAFDAPCVLENLVDIQKELSFVVARSKTGQIAAYPPAELVFDPRYNLVDYLVSPARIEPVLAEMGTEMAMEIANKLDLVGLLAVEMFLDTQGDLLVNEMAPRPHNSGHHTIEGNVTSQFEQHLRAILGLPLGSTQARGHSVMFNLIAGEGAEGPAIYQGMQEVLAIAGTHTHLYGKALAKPGRKMGHVTVVDEKLETALEKAIHLKNILIVRA